MKHNGWDIVKISMKWPNWVSTHKNACNLLNAIYLFDECMRFAYNNFRSIKCRPSHQNNSPLIWNRIGATTNYSILWKSKRLQFFCPFTCGQHWPPINLLNSVWCKHNRPTTIFHKSNLENGFSCEQLFYAHKLCYFIVGDSINVYVVAGFISRHKVHVHVNT